MRVEMWVALMASMMVDQTATSKAGQMAHDAADILHAQLAQSGALEARILLQIMARIRSAADDAQQYAADMAEDQRKA